KLPDNRWLGDFEAVIKRYAEDDPVRARRKSGDWVDQEAVLLDSPFPRLERIGVIERRRTPVENLIDRALSMSSTSPERLGLRAHDFLRGIRAVLAAATTDGLVTEVVESTALLAWRAEGAVNPHA